MSGWILVFAMALDAVFGEPRWLWNRISHPAVLMGRMIQWADDRFNSGTAKRAKGVLLVCALLVLSKIVAGFVAILPFSNLLEILVVAILLAQKSLCEHVLAVARGLTGSVSEGRKAVAMIVGRDTKNMDEAAIGRSAIESGAENLSDGVIAPVLFFLVFGLPGILAYKFINTADSMIGYRTPRHEEFGWAAARLDDVFNYIPARATALVIAVLSGSITNWGDIAKDARLHRSPNAGWPEAAMARALDVALSGPRSYEGEMRDFAFVNSAGRHDIMPSDIRKSVTWLWRVWGAFLAIALVVAVMT